MKEMDLQERIDILEKLIPYYEQVIHTVKNEMQEDDILFIIDYLRQKCTALGICFCASTIFHIDLYYQNWIQYATGEKTGYWTDEPRQGNTVEEILLLLQFRVNLMNKLLTQFKQSKTQ